MHVIRPWWVLVALVCGVGTLWGESPVVVEQASTVSAEEFVQDDDTASALDSPLTPEQIQMLQQTIDVGRIDLDRLRQIVDEETGHQRLRLSLRECIQLAVEQNPDLQVTRLEPLKSDADVLAAKGEFDPLVSATANYVRSSQQASVEYRVFGGIDTIDLYRTTGQTSLSGKLKWGTMYDVTFNLDKTESTYNSFIEEWNGGLTLTLSQPLLRGRGAKTNLARVRMAKNARKITELQLLLSVTTTVSEVVKAYWDLVGAMESVTVREGALANAERLLEISQKRFDIGTAAAIEVLQAKAGVATRQSDLIAARSRVADAGDRLKQLLNMRDDGIFSSKLVLPTDRPSVGELDIEAFRGADEELQESIATALQARPEILMAHVEIASNKVERSRAANDLLPTVDVTGSLYQGGRDHYLSGVFDGVHERTDNMYSYGFRGSIPIGNRAARGQFQRAGLTLRQSGQRLEKTKQDVMLSVRLAARALQTSHILVESNRQARLLQETNVAAEEKRLHLGVSTSYQVLQVQEDLTMAQTQEVTSRIAYEKALVDLRLAEGMLVDALGIAFAPPETEPPVTFLRSVYPREPK